MYINEIINLDIKNMSMYSEKRYEIGKVDNFAELISEVQRISQISREVLMGEGDMNGLYHDTQYIRILTQEDIERSTHDIKESVAFIVLPKDIFQKFMRSPNYRGNVYSRFSHKDYKVEENQNSFGVHMITLKHIL